MPLLRIARAARFIMIAVCAALPMSPQLTGAADTPTAPTPPARFKGIVTAASGAQITMTGEDGKTSNVTVAPDAWIVKGRPIKASDIKPGDFVATANVNNPDGTGTSTELRVFPPGLRLGEGSYPMDEPNTTMTNATVSGVVDATDGLQITVTYGASVDKGSPAGTRTIKLPANVQVVQWYRVAFSDIHIGNRVRGRGASTNGTIVADFVLVDDAPPPAAPSH